MKPYIEKSLKSSQRRTRWLTLKTAIPAIWMMMDMARLLTISDRGHWLVVLSVFMLPFWSMLLALEIQQIRDRTHNNL